MTTPLDWKRLEPKGVYARWLRPATGIGLALALLPGALALGLPIALANLVLFRDPRKIFFTQERVGRHGKAFRIFKFRTMRDRDPDLPDDRDRVTPFGRFLRDRHLDELPQLLNILRGDMGLIGPRPEMIDLERWASSEIEGFSERLVIRPGVTGYAQVVQGSVRDDVESYRRKLELDREYLRHLGPAMDLEIVLGTIPLMIRGRRLAPAPDRAPTLQPVPRAGASRRRAAA